MSKLCNTFKMLLLLIFISSGTVFSQSQQLKKHIEDKLIRIEKHLEEGEYDLALTKLEELESYKDYISNNENRLTIDFKKAEAHYGKNEQDEAMSLLLKGLDELEGLGNLPNLQIRFSDYIGKNFRKSKDYNRSLYYFFKALKSAEKLKDTVNILDFYSKIGSIYYFEKEIDSAVLYYEKVVDFNINEETEKIITNVYNNLSVLFLEEEEYGLAEEYANKSLKILQEQKDSVGAAIALINLSNILYKQNNFDKVKENYLKAYESINGLNNSKAIGVRESLLYNLAYVSEELNDFKNAYYYLEEAANLTDSLAKANITKDLSEITAKYNLAEEAKNTEEEKSKRQSAQYLFYSTIFVFITLLIVSYIFYRNYRLKQENELDKVINETQTKIINATIDAKEQERKSIAETLHDSVSALLSSANLHLQATKAQLKKNYPQEITKAQTIVNEASVKIRDLSHELISSVLLKFGLAFAVHDMCQKYSNSEISLFSDDNGVKRYEQNFEIKIYNIIEELVNNILKHSKASNATIMLAHRENDMLSIRMNDDGIGFDVKKAKSKGGLGLSHIEARIKVMKGVFNIVSSKDNGTSIFILVPIVPRDV